MSILDLFKKSNYYTKPKPQPEPETEPTVEDFDINHFFYISNNDTTISPTADVINAIELFYAATTQEEMDLAKQKICRHLSGTCGYSLKQDKATTIITAEFPETNNNYDSIYINFAFDITNPAEVISFDFTPRYWFKRR